MKKILILTEAGENIGLGHLSRALGMSDGFENIDILCYVKGELELPKNIENFNWHENSLAPFAKDHGTVVFDSYLVSKVKEREIKDLFKKVVAIDDCNRTVYDADLIINPNIYGDKIDYSNQKAKTVGGKNYIILRDDLIENKKPKVIGFAKNLLITVGGNDDKNILEKLIEGFQEEFIKIFVLAGSSYEKLSELYSDTNVEILKRQTPKELAELYGRSDIAITAAGVTMSELAFSGVPFVAIKTGNDQRRNIEAFKNAGMISRVLKAEDRDLIPLLKEEIERLKDEAVRKDLSFKGQCLIPAKGAGNILDEIINM